MGNTPVRMEIIWFHRYIPSVTFISSSCIEESDNAIYELQREVIDRILYGGEGPERARTSSGISSSTSISVPEESLQE